MEIGGELLVLLVEDEPGLQDGIALLLELEDYRVVRCNDGLEAMNKLAAIEPDLILTDYQMPRMNGGQLIRNVRGRSGEETRIILMSATEPNTDEMVMADAFLAKPFLFKDLLTLIRRVLNS